MSQQLTPLDGGVIPQIQTTLAQSRLNVLSPQYVKANGLESRPTQWVPEGRPIYRRLPSTSDAYQIDFYNIVRDSNVVGNTFVDEELEKVGYVYVPIGTSINGVSSCAVSASEGGGALLIQGGEIVWEYGKSGVLPTIVDLETLDVGSGVYELAYQLIYDDAPVASLYSVTDFSLSGQPLNITSSTDATTGWRYVPVNAFINDSDLFWSSEDSAFPTYAQPTTSYIQWESDLAQAYNKLVLRCPSGTAYSGTATLSYVANSELNQVAQVNVSRDTTGQFFQFDLANPALQLGWNVTFSDLKVSIQSITVSGDLTLEVAKAAPQPRAVLAMYPVGALPKTVENSQGEQVPATYCYLAQVDVNNIYQVEKVSDQRSLIQRDYVPLANWLTKPFDDDLINLYEQVSEYPLLWMQPESCLKQEYAELKTDQIQVEK